MNNIIPVESITDNIFEIRKQKVMLDKDLAKLYDVTTSNLNKAVRRNIDRFPQDFMFQLTKKEYESLVFQTGIPKRGGTRYMPYAFTEQGVSMLSAILNSKSAVNISIHIMRAFVKLRVLLVENDALRYSIEGLEKRVGKNERTIQIAINAIQQLITPPKPKKSKQKMGFSSTKKLK